MLASIDGIAAIRRNGWATPAEENLVLRHHHTEFLYQHGADCLECRAPVGGGSAQGDMLCMHSTPDSGIRQREGHKGATKGSCLFSQSEIMKHSARQMKRGSRIIL